MKTAKNHPRTKVGAPKKPRDGKGAIPVGKSTRRTTGQKKDSQLVDKSSSPPRPSDVSVPHLSQVRYLSGTTKRLSMPEHHHEQTIPRPAKIKLQLFPLDEGTQMGLHKDGYNPYLELTLSARKKISSVLRHISEKWGGSSIARGDPFLLPYNISMDYTSHRWTLNNTDITAGDVHAAIGSPSVFRLRYGWSAEPDDKSAGESWTSTFSESCLLPEGIQEGCSSGMESLICKGKQTEATNENYRPLMGSGAMDGVVANKLSSTGLIEPSGEEVRADIDGGHLSTLWNDNLTNISIGGLLGEVSLQGNGDPKSKESGGGSQPSQLISDSFDAFLAGKGYRPQGPTPPPPGSSSSILDAEDTCHAFLFQKSSSLGKNRPSSGKAYPRICTQDAGSKSFKHPITTEGNIPSGRHQGHDCQGPSPDMSVCSRIYDQERSLGLSGIKWTDSLGPFDLRPVDVQKDYCGDSISLNTSRIGR